MNVGYMVYIRRRKNGLAARWKAKVGKTVMANTRYASADGALPHRRYVECSATATSAAITLTG